jgi:hypothetical protein
MDRARICRRTRRKPEFLFATKSVAGSADSTRAARLFSGKITRLAAQLPMIALHGAVAHCVAESAPGRNVALCCVSALPKEMVFHLACQILARFGVGQIQAVFIHQHGLVTQPCSPSFLADRFPYFFSQFARVGCEVESLGFFLKHDALNSARHSF